VGPTRTAKSVLLKAKCLFFSNSTVFFSIDSNSDYYYFLSASVDKTIGLWKGKDEDVDHISFF